MAAEMELELKTSNPDLPELSWRDGDEPEILAETKIEKKKQIVGFSGLGLTIDLRPKSQERPTCFQCARRKMKNE